MDYRVIFGDVVTLLIVLNPPLAIGFVAAGVKRTPSSDYWWGVVRVGLVALALTALFAFGGNFLLNSLFHVSIPALRVFGGLMLVVIGLDYLRREDFTHGASQGVDVLAVTPLAMPLLVGPATITTILILSQERPSLDVLFACAAALGATILALLVVPPLFKRLDKGVLTAIARLNGFFIGSVGVQMIIAGIIQASKLKH